MFSVSVIDFRKGALEHIEDYADRACYRPGFYDERYWFGFGEGFSWYDKKPVKVIEMDWESTLWVITREDLFDNLAKDEVTALFTYRPVLDENDEEIRNKNGLRTKYVEIPIEEIPVKDYYGILVCDMS